MHLSESVILVTFAPLPDSGPDDLSQERKSSVAGPLQAPVDMVSVLCVIRVAARRERLGEYVRLRLGWQGGSVLVTDYRDGFNSHFNSSASEARDVQTYSGLAKPAQSQLAEPSDDQGRNHRLAPQLNVLLCPGFGEGAICTGRSQPDLPPKVPDSIASTAFPHAACHVHGAAAAKLCRIFRCLCRFILMDSRGFPNKGSCVASVAAFPG
ncbi:hypothetical protein K523DRAFT_236894 [Schizophyllum commune Tattone D]|nr:hypothetical protein K523DRAFT_236894 [Schizophyllum commune Tattone D]